MRAFAQRLLPFAVIILAAALSDRAAAQSNPAPAAAPESTLESAAVDALISNATGATEAPDEITVQGKKDDLSKYRLKMTQKRDKIVEVFNRVNSDEDNDIKCRTEKPTGSRMGHSVCRSAAEDAATAGAAKGMLDSLLLSSGNFISGTRLGQAPVAGGAQVAGLVGASKSRQEGAAATLEARNQLEAELKKLMEQNRQLYRAVVEYVEAKDEYNKARGAGPVIFDTDHPAPQ